MPFQRSCLMDVNTDTGQQFLTRVGLPSLKTGRTLVILKFSGKLPDWKEKLIWKVMTERIDATAALKTFGAMSSIPAAVGCNDYDILFSAL